MGLRRRLLYRWCHLVGHRIRYGEHSLTCARCGYWRALYPWELAANRAKRTIRRERPNAS